MLSDLGSHRRGVCVSELGASGRKKEQAVRSAPCKDCERRTVKPNCHATCKEYKEFVMERHEMYRKRAVESEIIGAYAEKSNRLNRKK